MYTLNCFAVLPATSSPVNNTKSTLKHVLHFLLHSHKSLNSYLKSPSAWLLPQILLPEHPYHCLTNLLPSAPLHPWHCLVIPGLCRHLLPKHSAPTVPSVWNSLSSGKRITHFSYLMVSWGIASPWNLHGLKCLILSPTYTLNTVISTALISGRCTF